MNLGHIYMGNYSYQEDHLVVTEGSFNLLKNSINWYNGSISDASIMNDEKLIMINFHKDW